VNKEFVTYNQALALKELGFDEPCFVFWTNTPKYKGDNIQLCVTDGSHGYSPNSISFKQDFLREGEVLAPTFSQAFRWFRDKHNLVFNFISYSIVKPGEYHWSITWHDVAKVSGIVKTYEEAEQACLDKLIEICKNK